MPHRVIQGHKLGTYFLPAQHLKNPKQFRNCQWSGIFFFSKKDKFRDSASTIFSAEKIRLRPALY